MPVVSPSNIVTSHDLNKIIEDFDAKVIKHTREANYNQETIVRQSLLLKYYESKLVHLNYETRGINTIHAMDAGIYTGNFTKLASVNALTTGKYEYLSIYDTLKNTKILEAYPTINSDDQMILMDTSRNSIRISCYMNDNSKDLALNFNISIPKFKCNFINIDALDIYRLTFRIENTFFSGNSYLFKDPQMVNEVVASVSVAKDYILENTNANFSEYKYYCVIELTNIDFAMLKTDKNISVNFELSKYPTDYIIDSVALNKGLEYDHKLYNNSYLSFADSKDNLLSGVYIDTIDIAGISNIQKAINEYSGMNASYCRLFIDGGSAPILVKNININYVIRSILK